MAIEDIGYTIFVEFLQMTEYPGAPFTGNIARDLIMFLLIPSIFIILIVYMMVGRVIPATGAGGAQIAKSYSKMRLLLGVGSYLFIIAGGYYRAFALLAGPYFIFLIFILGILYFFLGHFRGPSNNPARGGTGHMSASALEVEQVERGYHPLNPMDRRNISEEIKEIDKKIGILEIDKKSATDGHEAQVYATEITKLKIRKSDLQRRLKIGI